MEFKLLSYTTQSILQMNPCLVVDGSQRYSWRYRAELRLDFGSSVGVEGTFCIHDSFCAVSKSGSCFLQSYEGMRYSF